MGDACALKSWLEGVGEDHICPWQLGAVAKSLVGCDGKQGERHWGGSADWVQHANIPRFKRALQGCGDQVSVPAFPVWEICIQGKNGFGCCARGAACVALKSASPLVNGAGRIGGRPGSGRV